MTNQPLFQSAHDQRTDIIQVDRALESMRDAGFDLTAAIGEPLDNSIEADATLLRVLPIYGRGKKTIDSILIADNGTGIDPAIMHKVLSMGYSNRYNQRAGLGRFGVGLKLAGLSLGERIDVYSKQATSADIYHSYIDLEEIREGQQQFITTDIVREWPAAAAKLMVERDGRAFSSGTLVIFGKIDRLSKSGKYATSLEEKISDLRKFIARAYRTFLDTGRTIELDGNEVTLHDPLFQMDNPRIISRYKPADPRGQMIEEGDIVVDGHNVHVSVALVPREFRPYEGAGGNVDHNGRDIHDFQINEDNTARISILRNGREIYYDVVPHMLPGGKSDKVLRYVAVEVRFPAELDEYFQVRHVKRGAEPISKLRQELRQWLKRPVSQALGLVRQQWAEDASRRRLENGEHSDSMDTAGRVDRHLPKGRAGRAATAEEEERIVEETAEDQGLDPKVDATAIERIREQVRTKPITMFDANWPGKEFLDIRHLNGKSVVKINHRHAFFREVYKPIKKVADEGAGSMAPEDVVELARRAQSAIDLLFMAYARAEGMYEDPEQFGQLLTYWGMFSEALLKEQFKDQ
ncbi:ATP-binding protein [Nocardia cyriacigeorgica]|uniref:ATP-binding protein n=1 Tax=Nocardia cyriacigeorgica TaxID=135487 RepID=A0A5R8P4I3_9NOCA|nr:ATP-binding protein [Nocardia cyriacigeorgica]TLF92266.1 ATP-binding protein [Nocardia cyriacigeorgica]